MIASMKNKKIISTFFALFLFFITTKSVSSSIFQIINHSDSIIECISLRKKVLPLNIKDQQVMVPQLVRNGRKITLPPLFAGELTDPIKFVIEEKSPNTNNNSYAHLCTNLKNGCLQLTTNQGIFFIIATPSHIWIFIATTYYSKNIPAHTHFFADIDTDPSWEHNLIIDEQGYPFFIGTRAGICKFSNGSDKNINIYTLEKTVNQLTLHGTCYNIPSLLHGTRNATLLPGAYGTFGTAFPIVCEDDIPPTHLSTYSGLIESFNTGCLVISSEKGTFLVIGSASKNIIRMFQIVENDPLSIQFSCDFKRSPLEPLLLAIDVHGYPIFLSFA